MLWPSCSAQNAYIKNHTELYDHESAATLDAVYICIEPTAHTDTELRAIDLGLPFLVEKPMTLDENLAETIVKKVEEKEAHHCRRFPGQIFGCIQHGEGRTAPSISPADSYMALG